MSRDVNRTQKSNANAMRMRKFFENTMRMRCDARKKNLVRCECDAIFLSHFFAFSQNAKNRIMRKIAKCEKCDFCSRSAVLKNPVLSHAQNGVLDPEHAPWRTELTYFFIILALRILPLFPTIKPRFRLKRS